jgi:hypothetical protein
MNPFLLKVETLIVNPVIYFMIGLAFVYFLWGVVEYLIHADEPEARATGTQHMIWGVIGLAIMFSVFGIIGIIIKTFGIT